MERSAFWRERQADTFEDASTKLDIRICTNDEDWPVEIAGVNAIGEPIGLSLNVVDSIRLYYQLSTRFREMFTEL